MGLLNVLFLGLPSVFAEIAERAEQELYSDDAVRAELTELYHRLEAKTLSEEEFGRREAELVQRLEEIEERQRQRSGRGAG